MRLSDTDHNERIKQVYVNINREGTEHLISMYPLHQNETDILSCGIHSEALERVRGISLSPLQVSNIQTLSE